MPSAKACRQ